MTRNRDLYHTHGTPGNQDYTAFNLYVITEEQKQQVGAYVYSDTHAQAHFYTHTHIHKLEEFT